jgi:predicted membrane protein
VAINNGGIIMKKFNRILWGIVLVALGTIFALNALEIADINIFFDGWWTLFIIIPSVIGLLTEKDKIGNIITLLIGVGFLLAARDVFSFSTLWKLGIPIIVVLIGLRLIIGAFIKKPTYIPPQNPRDKGQKMHFVLFSGSDVDYSGEVFDGCSLTAVFGGIDCHLENAAIDKSVTVKASAVFGTIDVYLPQNVNAEVIVSSHFGKVVNERKNYHIDGAPTVQIKASAVFGGVNII